MSRLLTREAWMVDTVPTETAPPAAGRGPGHGETDPDGGEAGVNRKADVDGRGPASREGRPKVERAMSRRTLTPIGRPGSRGRPTPTGEHPKRREVLRHPSQSLRPARSFARAAGDQVWRDGRPRLSAEGRGLGSRNQGGGADVKWDVSRETTHHPRRPSERDRWTSPGRVFHVKHLSTD